MRYVHTNIISNDWKRLADFYVKVFQCELVPPIRNQSGEWLSKGTGVQNAKLQGAHLLLPGYGKSGPTLEIYQYQKIEDQDIINPNTKGFGHIAFEVNDVEKVVLELEKYGGERFGAISSRIIDDVGKITFVYARDPDGNLIELQNWEK